MKTYTYIFANGSVVYWYNKPMPANKLRHYEFQYGKLVEKRVK